MKKVALSAVLIVLIGTIGVARAAEVSNTSNQCADILLIFARGSSTNQNHEFLNQPFGPDFPNEEPEAGAFFSKFRTLLEQNYPEVDYKAMSVHDIPDKYSQRGYPASGIFGLSTLNNIINADVSWWPWGDYQQSVNDGTNEIVGYTRDQLRNCPNQSIVMGGYSQGAQVIGESLFWFTSSERSQIDGVALFGDPKYIGAETSPLPWQDPKPYPWKRGTAGGRARGIAEARQPYLPSDMEYKTLSWCFDDDFICGGVSGMRWGDKKKNAQGHTRYVTFGIPQAADEIFQRMTPKLYSINKSNGGIDENSGLAQPLPNQPNSKPIDAMVLVNTSAGVNDVLGTLRFHTDNVISPLGSFFSNTRFGLADFSEAQTGGQLVARYNYYQTLKPYSKPLSPTQSSELRKNMIQKLAYGTQSGGGIDRADPHSIAIEKTVMKTNWNDEATKHLILITDRPAKNPYSYNICRSSVWNNFHTGASGAVPLTCTTDPAASVYPVAEHPELCNTILKVITQETCTLEMATPGTTHTITRSIEDAIRIAQSQKVAVSIVVPHDFSPADTSFSGDPAEQLEYLAKSTGGLYLKYSVFDRASYSDMLWQILNHKPKQLRIMYKSSTDILDTQEGLGISKQIQAKTNEPVIFDASSNYVEADSYKWDFDGDGDYETETDGPNVEHTFTEQIIESNMVVSAFSGDVQVAQATLPISVTTNEEPQAQIALPQLPDNITAQEQENGDILVTWSALPPGNSLVIYDPESGLPIMVASNEETALAIDKAYYDGESLGVVIISNDAESERAVIAVEPYVAPEDTVTEEQIDKDGLGESDPEGALVGATPEQNSPAPATPQAQATVLPPQTVLTTQQDMEEGQVAAETTEVPQDLPTDLTEQEQAAIDQGNQNFTDYLSWLVIASGSIVVLYGLFHLHRLMKD